MGGLAEACPITYVTLLDRRARPSPGVPPLRRASSRRTRSSRARSSTGGQPVLWSSSADRRVLTAFYMCRLIFLTFFGDVAASTTSVAQHIHESPPVMTVPLIVLAILAVGGRARAACRRARRRRLEPFLGAGAGAAATRPSTLGARPARVLMAVSVVGRARPGVAGRLADVRRAGRAISRSASACRGPRRHASARQQVLGRRALRSR